MNDVQVVDDNVFRVVLHPEITANAQPQEIEDLQREFADWFPGPVLLTKGTSVKYKGKSCEVLEHSRDDPRTVLVYFHDDGSEERIVHTSLTFQSDAEQEMEMVQALEDPCTHKFIFGYNEFMCDGKLEREYWVSIVEVKLPSIESGSDIAAGPITDQLKAGQMPLQQDQSLCVVHVQYNGKLAESSAILRVSIRPTRSIELRSHRDKCVPCRYCEQRRDCKQCQRCSSIFSNLCTLPSRCDSCRHYTSKEGCKECKQKTMKLCNTCKSLLADACPKCWDLCDDCKSCLACEKSKKCADCEDTNKFAKCDSCSLPHHCRDRHCRDFKWANRYGKQLNSLPEILKKAFPAAPDKNQRLDLTDKHQRRFALLIGNSKYAPSQLYADLKNPVNDVEALQKELERDEIGFKVTILKNARKDKIEDCVREWAQRLPEDAKALIYLCGHGCQLRGEQYFVPVELALGTYGEDAEAVVQNAKNNFVNVQSSILDPVRRALQQAGLIITLWDCCRENACMMTGRS